MDSWSSKVCTLNHKSRKPMREPERLLKINSSLQLNKTDSPTSPTNLKRNAKSKGWSITSASIQISKCVKALLANSNSSNSSSHLGFKKEESNPSTLNKIKFIQLNLLTWTNCLKNFQYGVRNSSTMQTNLGFTSLLHKIRGGTLMGSERVR